MDLHEYTLPRACNEMDHSRRGVQIVSYPTVVCEEIEEQTNETWISSLHLSYEPQ